MTNDTNKRKIAEGYYGGDALDNAAERMIEREVLYCQSSLVDHCLSKEVLSLDDADNLYEARCPECGGEVKDEDRDDDDHLFDHRCTSCDWEGDHPDQEPVEVLQWFLVTDWLADKLRERGRVILSDGQSQWWGRTCCGQAILLDGIMQRIVCETGYYRWPEGSLNDAV